ncbi:hypothetical protein BCV70DRAFT_217692 [Testicularia cyperi]|uniref:GATA-type domain-containing protein n=1 Tax=Testicularia cyperi TaxID=1882483 RepID=A0A317XMM3_9BASI|nr:hypothetical protein BCV70DRAFT_217692 [Testicularia cyperi]
MAASTPLVDSPRIGLGRSSDLPFMARPKRSGSATFDHVASNSRIYGAEQGFARAYEISEEATFIPTTISEHLLERTYLDDVVRPLVRALVKARMTYGSSNEPGNESSRLYTDLEKLRQELERSAQRTRHAEQERDDLARRLDLAGGPDTGFREPELRDRGERRIDPLVADPRLPPTSAAAAGAHKRARAGDIEPHRAGFEPRSSVGGSGGLSVNVAHGEGPAAASITVTAEGTPGGPLNITSRPGLAGPPAAEVDGALAGYGGSGISARHRSYPELHPENERGSRLPPRLSAQGGGHYDHEFSYPDDRDRFAPGHVSRPSLSRYGGHGSAHSPPTAGTYLPSTGSERSSLPTLSTFSTTPSSSAYSAATPYSTSHAYEQEMELDERVRKLPRMRPSDPMNGPPMHAHGMGPGRPMGAPNSFPITPAADVAGGYPIRKLASTKNRTCSNCSAPHDAKFRRGPNGPGTLCDRCGSRWKKFKEQESAMLGGGGGQSNGGPKREPQDSASASAHAAAQARLSSASSSSQSPMDQHPMGSSSATAARDGDAIDGGASHTTHSNRGGDSSSSANISPNDDAGADVAAHRPGHEFRSPQRRMPEALVGGQQQDGRHAPGGRDRSASVDQLMDD